LEIARGHSAAISIESRAAVAPRTMQFPDRRVFKGTAQALSSPSLLCRISFF
jgi:hypothetical protein